MTVDEFDYHAMLKEEGDMHPSGLIAVRFKADPLQAVVWHLPKRQWIYSPMIAAIRIFDDKYADLKLIVDRPTAERIARENLGTELPTEEELLQMCEEGASQTDR